MYSRDMKPNMKIKTINISIPKEVLAEFDKVAEKMHWQRSTLIRLAVEYFIKTHYFEPNLNKKQKE